MPNKKPNVIVKYNKLIIYKMENQFCVNDFIRNMQSALRYAKRKNLDEINIVCLCAREHIFPDACLPISAIIQEYEKIHNIKINVKIKNNKYLNDCHFAEPLNLSAEEIKETRNVFNKIFVYESENGYSPQAVALNQAFVDCMSRTVECEEGVLKGLLWCIYEVMDNVLIHSQSSRGYVMAQYHKSTKRLAICVYDCGIGIFNSLVKGGLKPQDEIEAINLALQEGVGDGQGQGNGLYGLSQIVKANGGRFIISTGKSSLTFKNNNWNNRNNNPILSDEHLSTTVDFQLDLDKKTDITEALKSIGGIDDCDLRIDNMLQDDADLLVYKISDNADDYGTRQSGKALRNDIINILKRTKTPIAIDFSDIMIVSSSFIDELIAKMVIKLGYVQFNQFISLINMNDELAHLCNRAVAMRTNQEWESKQ